MSGSLSSGVSEEMPQATQTAGRSRVTRLFSRATDRVRCAGRREERRVREAPERTKRVWPEREEGPAGRQREVREGPAPDRSHLKGARACQTAEAMRDVYGCETAAEAEPMLDRLPGWTAHPDVPETGKVAKTIRENREGIPGYLDGRPANAYLEGANSLTRPVKRAARGFRNVGYFATAIFPGLGGLSFDALACGRPSPCYPPKTPKSQKSSVRGRVRPRTLQAEYVRRAECEIAEKGGYSWAADIRARIRVARSVTRSEDEFRGLLKSLGVEVENNSAKARRRDWIFSLVYHPTRRVSGESLGLGYGRKSLIRGFSLGAAGHLASAGKRKVAELARSAVEFGDLSELERLSEALVWLKSNRIRTAADLTTKGTGNPDMADYVQGLGILKESSTVSSSPSRYQQSSRLVPRVG